jgi:hypothetical protein
MPDDQARLRERHVRALHDVRAKVELDLIAAEERLLSGRRALAAAAAGLTAEEIAALARQLEALDLARRPIESRLICVWVQDGTVAARWLQDQAMTRLLMADIDFRNGLPCRFSAPDPALEGRKANPPFSRLRRQGIEIAGCSA